MVKGTKQVSAKKKSDAPAKVEKKQSLFVSTPKKFGVGQDIQPKRDLSRFVKWPKYVRIQRQRRILVKRLKVPPTLNQFTLTLEKSLGLWATSLFRLLHKYRPETKKEKADRLKAIAVAKAEKKDVKSTKPYFVKSGLNHVTTLIENKKALLVVIAHDVEPIERVLHLPALCRKMDIPYCIVKSKSRLGQVIHMKTATCLALTEVKSEDKSQLAQLSTSIQANFNDKFNDIRKQWGGGIMGIKAQHKVHKLQVIKDREAAMKARM